MVPSGGSSCAPGAIGCNDDDHVRLVSTMAATDVTRLALRWISGVTNDQDVGPELGVMGLPSNARSDGLSESVSSSSGGQSVDGSNLAIEVVTHRILPGTAGDITNGVRALGRSPAPKSDPNGMTARENVMVTASRPERSVGSGEVPLGLRALVVPVDGVREITVSCSPAGMTAGVGTPARAVMRHNSIMTTACKIQRCCCMQQ